MATRTARVDVHLTPDDARAALCTDVLLGTDIAPKQLPPKYFYDARGSALFEEITALPEYFPTRTEAGAAHRARRRDRRADGGHHAGRARVGVVGEDAAAARRSHRRRDAGPLRPARRQRGRVA
jgi:L-histidine N-alpha-methyltransferase